MQYFWLRHSYEVYLELGEKTERDLREQIEDPDLRKIKIESSGQTDTHCDTLDLTSCRRQKY